LSAARILKTALFLFFPSPITIRGEHLRRYSRAGLTLARLQMARQDWAK